MRFAGIDVGSQTHVVAIVDETGQVVLRPASFGEDLSGYQRLFELLGPPADILVALEATGHYSRNLFAALAQRSYPVALVNPLRTRRFAQEELMRAKTDSIDALGIARFAAQKRPPVSKLADQPTAELREIIGLHDRFLQDFQDRVRQLHRLVHLCFPEFTRYVRQLRSQRATAVLRKYPTAAAFDCSAVRGLVGLREAGLLRSMPERLAQDLVKAASISVGQHRGRAYSKHVEYVCQDIDELRARLASLEEEIDQRVAEHEVASLLTTIAGMGALSAARIVAAVGDPARFRHAGAFAAYVGAVPGTNRSGLRRPGHSSLCPLGNARLRRALYMTTLAVIRHNPWLGTYYHRLHQSGKLPKIAILAAMRKLLTAVYSVAKHRRPFVPRLNASPSSPSNELTSPNST
jgi:transposase